MGTFFYAPECFSMSVMPEWNEFHLQLYFDYKTFYGSHPKIRVSQCLPSMQQYGQLNCRARTIEWPLQKSGLCDYCWETQCDTTALCGRRTGSSTTSLYLSWLTSSVLELRLAFSVMFLSITWCQWLHSLVTSIPEAGQEALIIVGPAIVCNETS